MGKFEGIAGKSASWVDRDLYAESIPHLFHWDFAYLWILEKEAQLRPISWKARIEAWRLLVSLFMAGDLVVSDPVSIDEPLINYTEPFGVRDVTWVCFKDSTEPVGVLSPTVLVRPVPDFEAKHLEKWRKEYDLDQRMKKLKPDVRHFTKLICDALDDDSSPLSFAVRLAAILRSEFNPKWQSIPVGAKAIDIPMLRDLQWKPNPHEPAIKNVRVFVYDTDAMRVFVPRCGEDRCNLLLTRSAQEAHVAVSDDTVVLTCKNKHRTSIPISQFGIWTRQKPEGEAIVWDPANLPPALPRPLVGFPPSPRVSPKRIDFEWQDDQLGGERDKRFLSLSFDGYRARKVKVASVFFERVLVPGHFKKFSGLPIRAEWLDALENPDEVITEVGGGDDDPRIAFRNFQLKGWPPDVGQKNPPSTQSGIYELEGKLFLETDPGLAVGVYPNPEIMAPTWSWYRVFLEGAQAQKYELSCEDARALLPSLVEKTENVFPLSFSVASISEPGVGVTFRSPGEKRESHGAASDIYLGIDFGTTHSVVYYTSNERTFDPNPRKQALAPGSVRDAIGWIAPPADPKVSESKGSPFPSPAYGRHRSDPYLFPSALWRLDDDYLIRWDSTAPMSGARPFAEFKWDRPRENTALREAFLRELVFFCIPLVFLKESPDIVPRFKLGFSYPLAFGDQRKNFEGSLQGICDLIKIRSGHDCDFYTIYESDACVRAFGDPRGTETFLIADMGGGTMDLALFSKKGTRQLGSILFAGRDYIESFGSHKKGNDDPKAIEKFEWELRDAIFTETCSKRYGNDRTAQRILTPFLGMAFEFLRTMVEADRAGRAAGAGVDQAGQDDVVNLVLVGNGWRLVEAFHEGAGTKSQVFNQRYDYVMSQLVAADGKVRIRRYGADSETLKALPSAKHLVAFGALLNAIREKRVDEKGIPARLPLGRNLECEIHGPPQRTQVYDWHLLVGEMQSLEDITVSELQREDLNCIFSAGPPVADSPKWIDYLKKEVFNCGALEDIPYPEPQRIREQLRGEVRAAAPALSAGPLQLILESHWKKQLKKKH